MCLSVCVSYSTPVAVTMECDTRALLSTIVSLSTASTTTYHVLCCADTTYHRLLLLTAANRPESLSFSSPMYKLGCRLCFTFSLAGPFSHCE